MSLRRSGGQPRLGLSESVDWVMVNEQGASVWCFASTEFIEELASKGGHDHPPGSSLRVRDQLFLAMENEIHSIASAKYDRDGALARTIDLTVADVV
jgi:hypothetical protein